MYNNLKLNKMKTITLLVFITLSIFSCNKEDDQTQAQELPNLISLNETSLYPEGIVYSSTKQKTYVGSYFKGKIITVDLEGNLTDFVIDNSLVAVVGMAIDESNNKLYVCNSDAGISLKSDVSTVGILAEVIVYDLTTGEKIKTIDLSGLFAGGHFLNDLVFDANGNLYITDSFSPVIYKIDTNDNPSVLVTNSIFEVPQGAFGLNGIVYHPDNYLIVGKAFGGMLYKVPLNDVNNIQEIALDTNVNSLDGLLLTDNNTLALVSNNFTGAPFSETIYKIETSNNWTSANIANTFTDLEGSFPTTMTKIDNSLYVSYGYFPELIDPNSAPNNNFKLQKIIF